jgi:hypothetical protein
MGIWFDAVRLLPVGATAVNEAPDNGSWTNEATVTFQWSINNSDNVQETHLEASTQPDFATLAIDVGWPSAVASYTHTFSPTIPDLYWRVRLVTSAGEATSTPSHLHMDTAPPTSAVQAIYWQPASDRYMLTWGGSDAGIGVANYTIEMQTAVDPTWQPLVSHSTTSSLQFTPSYSGTIWFRSQATDGLGNIEPLHADPGDLSTDQAISLTHDIMLPLIKWN